MLSRRFSATSSCGIGGRPPCGRDFQRHGARKTARWTRRRFSGHSTRDNAQWRRAPLGSASPIFRSMYGQPARTERYFPAWINV